jgi:hypothetical protein
VGLRFHREAAGATEARERRVLTRVEVRQQGDAQSAERRRQVPNRHPRVCPLDPPRLDEASVGGGAERGRAEGGEE